MYAKLNLIACLFMIVAMATFISTIPLDKEPDATRLKSLAMGGELMPEITKKYKHILHPIAGGSFLIGGLLFVTAHFLEKRKDMNHKK